MSLGGLREALALAGITPATAEKALVRRQVIATDWVQAAGGAIQEVIARERLARKEAPARLRALGYSDAQIDYALADVIDREIWALAEAERIQLEAGGIDRQSLLLRLLESGHDQAAAETALENVWLPTEHDPDAALVMMRQALFTGWSERETREHMRQFFDDLEIERVMTLVQPDWNAAARRRLRGFL